jgi:hypothetical protein
MSGEIRRFDRRMKKSDFENAAAFRGERVGGECRSIAPVANFALGYDEGLHGE